MFVVESHITIHLLKYKCPIETNKYLSVIFFIVSFYISLGFFVFLPGLLVGFTSICTDAQRRMIYDFMVILFKLNLVICCNVIMKNWGCDYCVGPTTGRNAKTTTTRATWMPCWPMALPPTHMRLLIVERHGFFNALTLMTS